MKKEEKAALPIVRLGILAIQEEENVGLKEAIEIAKKKVIKESNLPEHLDDVNIAGKELLKEEKQKK